MYVVINTKNTCSIHGTLSSDKSMILYHRNSTTPYRARYGVHSFGLNGLCSIHTATAAAVQLWILYILLYHNIMAAHKLFTQTQGYTQ
jgi:hypothetical protein